MGLDDRRLCGQLGAPACTLAPAKGLAAAGARRGGRHPRWHRDSVADRRPREAALQFPSRAKGFCGAPPSRRARSFPDRAGRAGRLGDPDREDPGKWPDPGPILDLGFRVVQVLAVLGLAAGAAALFYLVRFLIDDLRSRWTTLSNLAIVMSVALVYGRSSRSASSAFPSTTREH
jgi:hypothetical protein